MPDCCRVKDDLCSFQCNAPGRLREPLVVTDEYRDAPELRGEDPVRISRVEVFFLEEAGVLRDVDFVVGGADGPVGIDDHGGIVDPAFRCSFQDRDNDDHAVPAGYC